MKKIILNGANGYVASNFILNLLQKKYKVIALARSTKKLSAEERMKAALIEMNEGEAVNFDRLEVYDYSLFEPDFSLSESELKNIFGGDVSYFHFAASLKFDTKSKDEIFGTNLEGLTNSIETFQKYTDTNSQFFFVSTAYSCGKINGRFYERFYENAEIDEFRNYYEQSKRYAENVVKNYMDSKGLNACILRLSQVVGNSQTGVTKTDYGIFDFSRRVKGLAEKYPNHELRLKIDPQATQNLIPINAAVAYLVRAVEVEQVPKILNLVAKVSIKNEHILNCISKLLPIRLVPVHDLKKKEMSALERILEVGMSFTGAYTNTNIDFDTTNLDKMMPEKMQEISPESVFQMLQYFLNGYSNSQAVNLQSAG